MNPSLPEDRVTLDYLKQTLGIFFREKANQTKTLRSGRTNKETRINEFIYELESHLSSLKKQYDINLSLNADISSGYIRQSFEHHQPTYLRDVDYQYSFLLFLACRHQPARELRQYIDDFLNLAKEQLTWADLVITETGATRAKTNIRFAVNGLRAKGLLPRPNTHGHALLPTMYGLWSLYAIRSFTPHWSANHPLSPQGLQLGSLVGFTELDDKIAMAMIDLKRPDFFQVVVETAVEEGFPRETAQHILTSLASERQVPRFDMDVFLARLGADKPVAYRWPMCDILQTMP